MAWGSEEDTGQGTVVLGVEMWAPSPEQRAKEAEKWGHKVTDSFLNLLTGPCIGVFSPTIWHRRPNAACWSGRPGLQCLFGFFLVLPIFYPGVLGLCFIPISLFHTIFSAQSPILFPPPNTTSRDICISLEEF